MKRAIVAGLVALMASACAETGSAASFEDSVREATRAALGDVVKDTPFTVTDIKASPMKVTWRVTAADSAFECDADNRLALPSCRVATAT